MIFFKLRNPIFCLNQILLFFKFIFSRHGFTKFLKLFCLFDHVNNMAAISGYTLAEQKVSKQQVIKISLPWLYI